MKNNGYWNYEIYFIKAGSKGRKLKLYSCLKTKLCHINLNYSDDKSPPFRLKLYCVIDIFEIIPSAL